MQNDDEDPCVWGGGLYTVINKYLSTPIKYVSASTFKQEATESAVALDQ